MRFSTPWNFGEQKSSRKRVTPPLPWTMHRSSARRKDEHRFPAYLFDNLADKKNNTETKQPSPSIPVRLSRNEDAVVVTLDVEGYRLPELVTTHYDGELVVTGEKKTAPKWWPTSKRKERFTKYIDLQEEEVDWDGAEAELENGQLQITIPRVEHP